MKRFFDVHVFYSRKNGFSIPVAIETDEDVLIDEDVIEFAVKNELLSEEDSDSVDSVEEIEESEYNDMKGI